MKPRDKTVLPFALPAISVVVVILFAMTGRDKDVSKLPTAKKATSKSESRPIYAAGPSAPSKNLTFAPKSTPVWPGTVRRLPPIELASSHVESVMSQLQDTLEPEFASVTNDVADHVQDFVAKPPANVSISSPSVEEFEFRELSDPSIDSSLNNEDSLEEPIAETTKRFDQIGVVEVTPFVETKTIEPESIESESHGAESLRDEIELFDPLFADSIPDPDTLLTPGFEEVEVASPTDTTDEPPGFAFDQDEPVEMTEASNEPEFTSREPEFASDALKPIEASVTAPVATVDSKEPWAPVDLRSVQVDMAVGDESETKTNVASGENKRQALKAVELGFELIQRGAPYSARARFIEAMRNVSRSLDEQNRTHTYTAALRKALSAYEEAGDFFPKSTRPDEDVNIASVVSGHDTEILHDADVLSMTSGQCVQEYLAFAEQEFTKAFGQEEVASRALYGLGRLEWATATTTTSSVQVRTFRAITLYQSSLVVFERNFAAANELGVLFARHGNYKDAISALRHCVALSPQPTAWQNLANLYRRLGKIEEARWAEVEATQSARLSTEVPYAVAKPRVEWVNPDEFNSVAQHSNTTVTQMPATAKPVIRTASRPTPPDETTIRSVTRRRSMSFGSRTNK